jgi:hypothetical protein
MAIDNSTVITGRRIQSSEIFTLRLPDHGC